MRASLRLTLYGFCTMLQASYAAGKLRGSVRRASGLVLTDYSATGSPSENTYSVS